MRLMRLLTILLLLLCGIACYWVFPHPTIRPRNVDASWVRIADQMGIQNMVTAVYLGPRIMDTFIEVMVVVLTVVGMKFLREQS